MTDDIRTIAWKELVEVRAGGAQGQRSTASMAVVTLVMAVAFPFSAGSASVGGLGVMAVGVIVSMLWVLTSVPDAFAGERDRRTLETLLATRLSAEAILAGKLLASVVVAASLGIVAIVLAVVASDVGTVVHGDPGDPLSVPWGDMGLGVVLVVLATFAMGNLCILVALRASSALIAMKELGLGVAITISAVSYGINALPSGASSDLSDLAADIGSVSPWVLAAGAALLFVALNAGLFSVTRARFTRPKLVRPHG